MQSEFKYKDRTTKRNKLIEGDPIAQFKEKMHGVFNEDKNKDNILDAIINIEFLEKEIDKIHESNPEKSIYLNPVAFILGFYILENKKINKHKFESLDNKFKYLMENNFISSIDVIRYARYFILNNEFKDIKEDVFEKEDDEDVFKEDDEDIFEKEDDKKMITENNLYEDEEYSGEEEYGNYEEYDDEPESLKKFK